MHDIALYDENGCGFFYAPDDEICLTVTESDNPEFGLEKTGDAVAVCAESVFGIKSLYPWQRLAISNILDAVSAAEKAENEGYDINALTANTSGEKLTEFYDEDGIFRGRQIVLLPTGAGKSLCFQIPALLMNSPTLVIYPLFSLMNDQFGRMKDTPLSPAIFRGGQTKEERDSQFARLEGRDGTAPANVIIANPEILAEKSVFERIKKRKPAHIAVDEAHCVTEWGDSFRPAYLELSRIIKELAPPAVTAFTATASGSVLKRISEILFEGRAHILRGESDRPNISYYVRQCFVKEPALLSEVKKQKRPLVIFCSSRGKTEITARFLRSALKTGNVKFYHAGLMREEKTAVENWFHNSTDGILTATCAFGMGVNKKDIKTVIHLDPPAVAEAYIQEAGRAGRDGSKTKAVLLWSPEDGKYIQSLSGELRRRAAFMQAFAESGRCRREVLLEALGEKTVYGNGEKTVCAGCDICDKTAQLFPSDGAALLNFIKKHNRMFSKEELIAKLKKENPLWRASDLNSLIMQLINCGKIAEGKYLWKDKISVKT